MTVTFTESRMAIFAPLCCAPSAAESATATTAAIVNRPIHDVPSLEPIRDRASHPDSLVTPSDQHRLTRRPIDVQANPDVAPEPAADAAAGDEHAIDARNIRMGLIV